MKVTQAEVSITTPEGAILRLRRYHNSSKKGNGPAHCCLEAQREDAVITLPLEECVAPPAMPQLLDMLHGQINRVILMGIPEYPPPNRTIEGFVWKMKEAGMFLTEFMTAEKK